MFARTLALGVLAVLTAAPALAARPAVKPSPAAHQPAPAPVTISGAWIREAPPGAEALGGYLTIANPTQAALTLEGLTSPLFASIEMHNVVEEDGRMHMQRALRFEIPAGGTLVFKPRDRHFMLLGPKKELKAGDQVPLTLNFGQAGTCTITVDVKRPGG